MACFASSRTSVLAAVRRSRLLSRTTHRCSSRIGTDGRIGEALAGGQDVRRILRYSQGRCKRRRFAPPGLRPQGRGAGTPVLARRHRLPQCRRRRLAGTDAHRPGRCRLDRPGPPVAPEKCRPSFGGGLCVVTPFSMTGMGAGRARHRPAEANSQVGRGTLHSAIPLQENVLSHSSLLLPSVSRASAPSVWAPPWRGEPCCCARRWERAVS
jgi:hypothetical protein